MPNIQDSTWISIRIDRKEKQRLIRQARRRGFDSVSTFIKAFLRQFMLIHK